MKVIILVLVRKKKKKVYPEITLTAYLATTILGTIGIPAARDCIISPSRQVWKRPSILEFPLVFRFSLRLTEASLNCIGAGRGLLALLFPLGW